MDRKRDGGWMNERMMSGWIDRKKMNGYMDRWTDRKMGAWMDE